MSEETRVITADTSDFQGGSQTETPPEAGLVHDLTLKQQELAAAMQRLIRFQRESLTIKNTNTVEETLDAMEQLLIEVVEFSYFTLQYRDDQGTVTHLQELVPPGLEMDESLVEWAMNAQTVSVTPLETGTDVDSSLRSLLFMPMGSHYIMILWLEQPVEAFTQEQEALLSVLARETASVLETHYYRLRLEKASARMTDIVESVPLGLLAVDASGIVYNINSTAEIALDVRRGDVLGNKYTSVLPQQVAELLRTMTPGQDLEGVELEIQRPDGGKQHLGISTSPIQSVDSEETARLVIIRDLQLSHEVQKLRELDAMKTDFLSLVTHELRTPLTSIIAYSEALAIDDSVSVPPEWREYISVIHNEGKHLCHLVDNILDLTKMESGKMEYMYEMQDINELVTTVVMALTTDIEKKNLELELELEDGLCECRVAADRFTQALSNIVSNAVKFNNQGGSISIRSRKSEPFPGTAMDTITIEVEDTGIGIAEDHQEKVFSKFEIAEAVENHTLGSGLGLAISRQIIEEGHGGKVWLTSEVGKGTTVFIQIPINA